MTRRAGAGYGGGWPALVAALTLVLCASSGLGAGALARSLVGQSSGTVLPLRVNASPPKPTNTPPAPSVTAAPASIVAAPSAFTLTMAITPNQLSPGQRFTVVATVFGQDGVSRVQGVQCSMRAPTNGLLPLLAQWPSPVITDADGLATWSLLAPQALPGRYALEVIAYGPHQYYFFLDALVTLVAGTSGG